MQAVGSVPPSSAVSLGVLLASLPWVAQVYGYTHVCLWPRVPDLSWSLIPRPPRRTFAPVSHRTRTLIPRTHARVGERKHTLLTHAERECLCARTHLYAHECLVIHAQVLMWYRKARRSQVLEPDATGLGIVENAACAAGAAGDDVAGVREDVPWRLQPRMDAAAVLDGVVTPPADRLCEMMDTEKDQDRQGLVLDVSGIETASPRRAHWLQSTRPPVEGRPH